MSPKILPYSFLFLLLSSGLAGCVDQGESSCWKIPLPAKGYVVEYELWALGAEKMFSRTATVSSGATILRGDGHPVDAMTLRFGGETAYHSLATGDDVGYLFQDVRHFSLNHISQAPPLLSGSCLSAGDLFEIPWKDGVIQISAEVVRSDDLLVVDLDYPPGLWAPVNGYFPHTRSIQMSWTSKDSAFPDQIVQWNASNLEQGPTSTRTVVRQEGPLMEEGIGTGDLPFSAHRPTGTDACWETLGRHGDFRPLQTHAPYEDYLKNMSEDRSLQQYLTDHKQACAVMVTYEIVTEPSSTAYVWTSSFADRSELNYLKRWVVRCYDEVYLQILYGQCTEHATYRTSGDRLGLQEGPAVNTSAVESDLGLSTAVENVDRLTDHPFTRFVWHANRLDESSRALTPVFRDEPSPGLVFDFGTLTRNVDYAGYRGVEPGGGRWEANMMFLWPSGWAYMINEELLRPVAEKDP